jgi:hypothetical protein
MVAVTAVTVRGHLPDNILVAAEPEGILETVATAPLRKT